jgi:hypothetical protein
MANAATSAATSAATAVIDPSWSVNQPAGYPAQEKYPGALDSDHADDDSAQLPDGSPGLPVETGPEPFGSWVPAQAEGGGYIDTSFTSGHDAPEEAWDSSAGEPFAPSGAINPELHGQDTGAVYQFQHVAAADIGMLTRHTSYGQTFNRVAPDQTTIGQTAVNNRQDMDQYQYHNPNGHDPWEIPYAERPIYNNVAYEAEGINPTDSQYTPSGELPDRAPYQYGSEAYEAPPDPDVSAVIPQSSDSGVGGGWL